MIRKTRLNVGDTVKTPKGTVGRITHIGEWSEGNTVIGIVYRVGRNYWSAWQLKRGDSR